MAFMMKFGDEFFGVLEETFQFVRYLQKKINEQATRNKRKNDVYRDFMQSNFS